MRKPNLWRVITARETSCCLREVYDLKNTVRCLIIRAAVGCNLPAGIKAVNIMIAAGIGKSVQGAMRSAGWVHDQ